MSVPNDRRYSPHHVWVMPEGNQWISGITEHAQEALGTIETIELPTVGQTLVGGKCCGSIESLKTVSDLIAPLSAAVIAHNEACVTEPTLVNDQPYADGWLLRLSEVDGEHFAQLLDAKAYTRLIDV